MTTFKVGIYDEWTSQTKEAILEAIEANLKPLNDLEFSIIPHDGGIAKKEVIDQYDALLILGYKFPTECFDGLKRLKCIARWGVGFDKIDTKAATEAGVAVAITIPSVQRPVAEGIIAMIMSIAKTIPKLDKFTRNGNWREGDWKSTSIDIQGYTLGTIGVGNIGSEACRIAKAIGFARVLAYDPFVIESTADTLEVELTTIEKVLSESDFVMINVPLNKHTKGMIGEKEIGMMKKTAYLVNTSRGPVVQEAPLVAALKSGKIAGAALDVFEEEPPKKDNSLFQLDNVIVAPHAVAWTKQLIEGNSRLACENIVEIYKGFVPKYLANREVAKSPKLLERLIQRDCSKKADNSKKYPNKFKAAVHNGKPIYGHMLTEFATKGIACILESVTGLDFVLIDMEHSGIGFDRVSELLVHFVDKDILAIVRVPNASLAKLWIPRLLDAGADGIMLPNVKSADEAREAVSYMKYPPDGVRGVGLTAAHTSWKGTKNASDFIKERNSHTILICMIESQVGVKAAEDIAAVDGVDCLWVGHYDLSCDLGVIADFYHDKFKAELQKIIDAAKKQNIPIGIQQGTPFLIDKYRKLGFTILSYGTDVRTYKNCLEEAFKKITQ